MKYKNLIYFRRFISKELFHPDLNKLYENQGFFEKYPFGFHLTIRKYF